MPLKLHGSSWRPAPVTSLPEILTPGLVGPGLKPLLCHVLPTLSLHPFTWKVPRAPLGQVLEAWPGCPASSRVQGLWPERFLGTLALLPQDRTVTGSHSPSGPPQSTAAPQHRYTLEPLNQGVRSDSWLSVPAGLDHRPFRTDRMFSWTQMLP